MQLCYSIGYHSNHTYYKSIIDHLIADEGLQAQTLQSEEKIYIIIDDEQEKINTFFVTLGEKLPLSIYMQQGELEENLDTDSLKGIKEEIDQQHWLTPEKIESIIDPQSGNYFNPLLGQQSQTLTLSNGERFQDFKEALSALVEALMSGKRIGLQTYWGEYVFCLSGVDRYKELLNEGIDPALFIADVNSIALLLNVSEKEMQAMHSIEKPKVRLFFKEDAAYQTLSDIPSILAQMPFDVVSFLLGRGLIEKNIPYVYVWQSKESELSLKLGLDSISKTDLEVVALPDQLLVVSGERSILPKKLHSSASDALSIAAGYGCTSEGNGTFTLDRLEHLTQTAVSKVRILESENIDVEHGNKDMFHDYEGAVLSVLAEHGKLESPTAGVYLSLKNKHSCFCAYRDKKRPHPVITFEPIPANFNTIFEEIAKIDENSPRLIENFKNKFPETYMRLLQFKLEGKNSCKTLEEMFSLFGMCMGFDQLPFDRIYPMMQVQARYFALEGSVKLDMYLDQGGSDYVFEWRKTLRSIMSFRMADLEKEVMAYAIFESFSDFINDNIHEICKKLDVKHAALCGDLFSNTLITKRVIKHSTHIYTPLFNRQLPIDGMNIAYGGVYV